VAHRTWATHRTAHRAAGTSHGAAHLGLLHLSGSTLHLATLHGATLHGAALHGTTLHLAALHLATLHGTALHLATLHGTALHVTALHRAALHRTGAVLTLRAVAPGTAGAAVTLLAMGAGPRGELRRATRQLRRAHLRGLLLDRRSGYGGRYRSARSTRATGSRPILRFRRLAHALLLLVLRGRTRRGGQLGPQVLVLAEQASQFGLDLVKKGIDLVLVIAFSEADGRELLVPHVLGGQRHLFFTST
jgi:hypothetical protein